jgi:hypothetical protein
VFRTALVAIVLTLVIGQDASVLCKAWCSGAAPAAGGCYHKHISTSRSVKGDDDCGRMEANSAVVVREDLRRDRHDQSVLHAVVFPSYQFSSMGGPQAGHPRRHGSSLQPLPLMIALRI